MPGTRRDFYEVQSRQRRRSLLLFGALVLFYFAAVGLVSLALLLTFGIFAAGGGLLSGPALARLLLVDFLISALVAWFHFQDARKFGARYILDRLEVAPPDPADRYHAQFLNTLEEIRIAAGAPRVAAYVLPTSAVNSMGLANRGTSGSGALLYIVVTWSSIVMRLLGTLISRERELMADAGAVEFGREPTALPRAIYKAHVRNSFVGDFSASYALLFIVSPDSRNVREGLFGRLFNTHPPVMKRIEILAGMAAKRPEEIIRQVWDGRRERARDVLTSFEETRKERAADAAEGNGPGGSPSETPGPGSSPSRSGRRRSPRRPRRSASPALSAAIR